MSCSTRASIRRNVNGRRNRFRSDLSIFALAAISPEIAPSFLDVAELRAGPWVAASSRGERGDVESGVVVSLGNPFHPKWGALSARSGIGYGAFDRERALHGNLSLAWRFSWTAAEDEGLIPNGIVRFVGTYRPLFSSPGQEVLFGIELSPALFIPQLLRTPSPG